MGTLIYLQFLPNVDKQFMSTNSIIAKKIGKEKYRAIFCQCDGDLTDTGRILSRYYTKPERVDQLLALGDIYALGERLSESEKEKPGEDVTIAYARDRGEELCPAKEYPFEELFDLDTPYVYIFVKEDKAMEYLTAASEHGNTFARALLERIATERQKFIEQYQTRIVSVCVSGLVQDIARILQTKLEEEGKGNMCLVDRKLRRQIEEKKQAQGLKHG